MEERFPKLLWQTYKSAEQLPSECAPCIHSWTSQNPGWSYQFCSDEHLADFFRTFFPPDITELFGSLPLGVMKADLWRYAVLWEFGGFYTDIDTICREPLDSWLDREKGLHVACENHHPFFCQWTIGAARHHPLLARAMEMVVERVAADGGVDESRPHYVHHYTGPGLWTAAIQRYLGRSGDPMSLFHDKMSWADKDMEIYPSHFFDGTKVRHFNASYYWKDSPSGYASWLYERKDVGRLAKPESGVPEL